MSVVRGFLGCLVLLLLCFGVFYDLLARGKLGLDFGLSFLLCFVTDYGL